MKQKWSTKYWEVLEINEDYLLLTLNSQVEKCYKEDISDYKINLERMFTIGKNYRFSIFENEDGTELISYKFGRPKLLKKRSSPTATLNGFKAVSNHMHSYLKTYKIENDHEK